MCYWLYFDVLGVSGCAIGIHFGGVGVLLAFILVGVTVTARTNLLQRVLC